MKFVSEKYRQLNVHNRWSFVDGELETDDKEAIEVLKGLDSDYGVRAVGGRPSKSVADVAKEAAEADAKAKADEEAAAAAKAKADAGAKK